MKSSQFLSALNEAQQEAVAYISGPALVVAGAGSGKTRVITHKLAYLIEQGYAPEQLYALTFTNKAAREMRQRIQQMLDPSLAYRIHLGTFHSIFARLLRRYAPLLGYTSDFTIYDRTDSTTVVKQIVDDLSLDNKLYTPRRLLNRISAAKNNLMSAEAYAANSDLLKDDERSLFPDMYKVYALYSSRCKQNNAMDFDDLLYLFNVLLRDFPDVLSACQDAVGYLLIDEYQDTNLSQFTIVRKLVEQHQRVFAVGDDAQSIYAFRGANIHNMLGFNKVFPEARIFKLEENYRSTQNIVGLANRLIAHNSDRIPKELYSNNPAGSLTELYEHENAYLEAERVARLVALRHIQDGVPYSECAILYRTNAQSRLLEDALRRLALPYTIYGGTAFYSRKEIKQAMAYLQVLINPQDNAAVVRTLDFPKKGIGAKTVEKVTAQAEQWGVSLLAAIERIVLDPKSSDLNAGIVKRLDDYLRQLYDLSQFPTLEGKKTDGAPTLAQWIGAILQQAGFIAAYSTDKNNIEDQSRLENLNELISSANDFEEQYRQDPHNTDAFLPLDLSMLSAFVQGVSLLTDQDTQPEEEGVLLMTIHSAKGLEFDQVFVCGLEEGLLPSMLCIKPSEIEEERRLLYVAITRARKHCSLHYSTMRRRAGKDEYMMPSRFIKELSPKYLQRVSSFGTSARSASLFEAQPDRFSSQNRRQVQSEMPFERPNYADSTPSKRVRVASRIKDVAEAEVLEVEKLQAGDMGTFVVGDGVVHNTFGTGRIVALYSDGRNSKADVQFDRDGQTRKLLLRFAKMRKME